VNQGEATAGQVQAIAGELVATSRANREALIGLIRYEIDRALGRLGLATADEVAALRAQVHALEVNLRANEHRLAHNVGAPV
jgi:polyhydroxyalkanoate synthesis regulator phasin